MKGDMSCSIGPTNSGDLFENSVMDVGSLTLNMNLALLFPTHTIKNKKVVNSRQKLPYGINYESRSQYARIRVSSERTKINQDKGDNISEEKPLLEVWLGLNVGRMYLSVD